MSDGRRRWPAVMPLGMTVRLPTLLPTLLSALLELACTTPSTTQRIVDGRILEGRYVAPEAYAAVLHAELLAQQGLTAQAYTAYQEASELAPHSAAVWTRLGALGCQLRRKDHDRAFAKAEARDASYEPLWRARAECALAAQDATGALHAAERAVALDPNQRRNTEIVAQALSQLRQTTAAIHWQQAFELRGLRHASLAAVTRVETEPAGDESALDQALRAHDLPRARHYALRTRLDPSALALHALRLGLPRMALEQAQLVLSANPLDADARVAALSAADLLHDAARFQTLLVVPSKSSSLRPAAETELVRLLSRRVWLADEAPAATGAEH